MMKNHQKGFSLQNQEVSVALQHFYLIQEDYSLDLHLNLVFIHSFTQLLAIDQDFYSKPQIHFFEFLLTSFKAEISIQSTNYFKELIKVPHFYFNYWH
jgi:hypothetical protein